MISEVWKDIPGYEGLYQVSDSGRVKSINRYVPSKSGSLRLVRDRIMCLCQVNGYPSIQLNKFGKAKMWAVHRLMAMAFLNHTPRKYKLIVDHIDNDRSNNNIGNLQIISQRLNSSKDRIPKSGHTGVVKETRWKNNKWLARIVVNGKREYLGTFKTAEQAKEAYEKRLHEITSS